MKKYSFDLYPELISYNTSIRKKQTIINIITGVTRFLINASEKDMVQEDSPIKEGKIRIVIYIDKMSRIFIIDGQKIHSFCYPFQIKTQEKHFIVSFEQTIITSAVCSVLTTVFKDPLEEVTIECVIERYWDVMTEFEIEKSSKANHGQIVTLMLLFEPGYLRFDHDEEHNIGDLHPLNHIDINYTNDITFKIGLLNIWKSEQMIDLVNINTPCLFLREKNIY